MKNIVIRKVAQLHELTAKGGSIFINATSSCVIAYLWTETEVISYQVSDRFYKKLKDAGALYNPGILQVNFTKLSNIKP